MLFGLLLSDSVPSIPDSALSQSIGRGRGGGLRIVIKMLKLLVVWHVAGLNGGIGNLDFERQAEGVGDFRHAHGREGTGQRAGVAQARVPAVSRLVSTPVRGGDIGSKVGVGMSADAAGCAGHVQQLGSESLLPN